MPVKLFFFCFVFLFIINNSAYSQTADEKPAPREVKITGTQLLNIHSSITGRDYDLYVNLPRGYNDTIKKFPVVFVLDGQWDFALVESIFGQQYYDGFVPGLVVVGITWSGKNANYDSLRALDLTPTAMNNPSRFGDAPKFLQFIKDELIPFIQSKYRVDKKDRTLMGSSLGGLFTLYALFNQTNLFDNYVCTSPAVTWDKGVLYNYEKEYASKHSTLPARLYMAIGGYEFLKPFEDFANKIKQENFGGLEFDTKVIEGMGHSGGKSEGFSRGLQFVFKRPEVNVADQILEQYAGEYQVSPNMNIKLTVEKSRLQVHMPDGSRIILHARSNKDFYMIGAYIKVRFSKDAGGNVKGFELEQFTGKSFIKKIN